jgi:ABC-type uncharacterized transport system involved in gliding motility auxiliary subunit
MPLTLTSNKWREGSLLTLLSLIFVAILVGINLIGQRFPWRLDLTAGQRYSISGQSQKIAKRFKQEVWIRAFFQEGNPTRKKAQFLFEIYGSTNPLIHFQFIDPDRQPALAQQYGVRNYGALILESGGKTQSVAVADEEGLTNGLWRLMQTQPKKVVFVTGHGEKGLQDSQGNGYSLARGILEKENYRAEEVNLLANNGIPKETACLVIADPKKSLFPQEIEDLNKYVQNGGRVILMLEPYQDGGLKEWLGTMGLTLQNDIIIDKASRLFGGDYLIPMAGSYGQNPITDKFTVTAFFPTARSLALSSSPPAGFSYDILVRSSSQSWGETDRGKLEKGEAVFDAGRDLKGPLNLAVLISVSSQAQRSGQPSNHKDKTPQGKVAVFGDSDFADNRYFNVSGNGDLFLNTVNYLTEAEALIAIRPAKSPVRPLSLSSSQALALFLIPVVLMPILIIGAGFLVWKSRRKAR